MVEAGKKVDGQEQFLSPHTNRPRKKPKTDLNDFSKCVIGYTVNEFHLSEKQRPTLKRIMPVLET
jgi:hypothetical protein